MFVPSIIPGHLCAFSSASPFCGRNHFLYAVASSLVMQNAGGVQAQNLNIRVRNEYILFTISTYTRMSSCASLRWRICCSGVTSTTRPPLARSTETETRRIPDCLGSVGLPLSDRDAVAIEQHTIRAPHPSMQGTWEIDGQSVRDIIPLFWFA